MGEEMKEKVKERTKNIFFFVLIGLAMLFISSNAGIAQEEELCYTDRVTDAPSFNIYTGWSDANNPKGSGIWPRCIDGCTANDVGINSVWLDVPGSCTPGEPVTADVWMNLLFHRQNTYCIIIVADLYEDGVLIQSDWTSDIISYHNGGGSYDYKMGTVSWTCGNTLEMRNILVMWGVNAPEGGCSGTCDDYTAPSKCNQPEDIIVTTPLVADFEATAEPSSQTIAQDESTQYTVSLTSLNGFDSPVTLSVAGLPSGATAAFTPESVTPSGESTLEVSTSASTPAGTYELTIKGEGGGKTHSTTVTLIIKELKISIEKTADKATVSPGETVTFTIKLQNKGERDADDVRITDFLPKEFTYINDTSGIDPAESKKGHGIYYTWEIGTFRAGESKEFDLIAEVGCLETEEKLKNKAYTYTGEIEDITAVAEEALDSSEVKIKYKIPSLFIEKIVDKERDIAPGDILTYTITYKSDGGPAYNVKITDTFSPKVEYLSDTSGVKPTKDGNKYTWEFSEIEKDKKSSFELKAKVTDRVEDGEEVENKVTISAECLGEADDDTSSEVALPVLTIVKDVNIDRAMIGDILTYTIRITNNGGSAWDVVVTDILPIGFQYIEGRTLFNGSAAADPEGENPYAWKIERVDSETTFEIKYQVAIGTNARPGRNDNFAEVISVMSGIKAGPAIASVVVESRGMLEFGRIEGTVFIDYDGNETQGERETGVEGVTILFEDGTTRQTDENGEYLFENVIPDEHVISVDSNTLPQGFKLLGERSKFVRVLESSTRVANFPVKVELEAEIYGKVYVDKTGNRVKNADDPGVAGVIVSLNNEITATTDENGEFRFSNLKSGKYILSIEKFSDIYTPIGRGSVEVDVGDGGKAQRDFGLQLRSFLKIEINRKKD